MTAVEWLAEMVFNEEDLQDFVLVNVINQAKKMEKEQKIEFACAVYDKYNFGLQEISFREECEKFKSE